MIVFLNGLHRFHYAELTLIIFTPQRLFTDTVRCHILGVIESEGNDVCLSVYMLLNPLLFLWHQAWGWPGSTAEEAEVNWGWVGQVLWSPEGCPGETGARWEEGHRCKFGLTVPLTGGEAPVGRPQHNSLTLNHPLGPIRKLNCQPSFRCTLLIKVCNN